MNALINEEKPNVLNIVTSIVGLVGAAIVGKILVSKLKNFTQAAEQYEFGAKKTNMFCSKCGKKMNPILISSAYNTQNGNSIKVTGYECPDFTSFANTNHNSLFGVFLDTFGRSVDGYLHDSDRKDSIGVPGKYCVP